MRTDLETMLLPLFPESGDSACTTSLHGYAVSLRSHIPGVSVATATDRKILNLLAGRLGENIRAGMPPSRHIAIETRALIEALAGDNITGGSEYHRIEARLDRLHATVVDTELPLGDGIARRRVFHWIDAYQYDHRATPGGRKIAALTISLSEDAFYWITRHQGFDLARDDFQALTASRSSVWRIYEVCLARLLRTGRAPARIPLDELRRRVPIGSETKVFKNRTLKGAMAAIAADPRMARHIQLDLERKTATPPDGTETGRAAARPVFRPLARGERAPLDSIHVRIDPGPGPLPRVDRLLAEDAHLPPESKDAPGPGAHAPHATDAPDAAAAPVAFSTSRSAAAPDARTWPGPARPHDTPAPSRTPAVPRTDPGASADSAAAPRNTPEPQNEADMS